jgi:hypothetical protein
MHFDEYSVSTLYAFRPDANRARVVDAGVRASLADSISTVLKALASEGGPPGDDLVKRVRAGPIAPVVFGVYTELVEAIFADNIDTALELARELCAPDFASVDELRIVTLSDRDLGASQAARYRRFLDDDPEVGRKVRALAPADLTRASEQVGRALALLDAAAPELANEIRTLVHEIVLVDTDDDEFGASTFQLWGALFLKVNVQASRVEIAEALAHESAHALLFGFGMGKPLVLNQAQARYASPLRKDPRPMDGVVHATYVIARMHYTVTRLLESELLTAEEQQVAFEAQKRNARHYADGWAVIDTHARWTLAGEAALAAARAYMDDNATISQHCGW